MEQSWSGCRMSRGRRQDRLSHWLTIIEVPMLRRTLVLLLLSLPVFAATTPRPLADIFVSTTDTKKIPLKQYKGKVVLIVMIATTCKACGESVQMLNKVQKDFGPRGAQVIAVAINDNAAYLLEPFVQRYRPIFPVGYLDREPAMQLAAFKKDDHPFVPIFLFVDRKGIVRFQYFGNEAFFKEEEKGTRGIMEGLLRQ